MPRGFPHPKPIVDPPPKPQGKVRRFFSKNVPLPSFLKVPAAATPPPRPVTSERVLAALQPDTEVVVAAKTFVKEKMGDNKYEVADKTRVTRTAAGSRTGIRKAIPVAKPVGRPPGVHKVSTSKAVTKRLAIGAGLKGSVASRLKANARGQEPVTRKSTLRSHTVPRATESTPAPASTVAPPAVSASTSRATPAAQTTPAPSTRLALSVNPAPRAEGITVGSQEVREANPARSKEYMHAGLYCQDEHPPEEAQLAERVLYHKGVRKPGRPRKSIQSLPPIPTPEGMEPSFPPFPLDHGYRMFFEQESEFRLPYNIMWERDSGALDGKKRPPSFGKLRTSEYRGVHGWWNIRADRDRPVCGTVQAHGRACCLQMRSQLRLRRQLHEQTHELHLRQGLPDRRPVHQQEPHTAPPEGLPNRLGEPHEWVANSNRKTGPRGFGVFAGESISEGDFVMDYRGEVSFSLLY